MNALFLVTSIIAVVATIGAIAARDVIHALVSLIVSLLATALIFYIFGASFAAAIQIIVYAGAIIVLFVFAIMMMPSKRPFHHEQRGRGAIPVWFRPAALCAGIVGQILYIFAGHYWISPEKSSVAPHEVGASLFGSYFLAVEFASTLLLAGLVAAYHLGRKDNG